MSTATIDREVASETLMDLAQQLLGGNRARSMKVIYAKRPSHDVNTGRPLQNAGYVTWIDNDTATGAVFLKIAQGWKPMQQYGTITAYPDEGISPWKQILEHPKGPAEFPVEQLLEQGWFDPAKVERDTGVANVRFPQLRGQKITLIPCPDCTERTFQKPLHLAIHCRNTHNYDRADIQALGRELGIDFTKELYKGRPRETVYDYTDVDEPEPDPVLPPDAEVERIVVRPRAERAKRVTTQAQKDGLARARAAQQAKKAAATV
jgi:hypothetical protein